MVTFICGGCGMSFKKKQVQRHMYSSCRVTHLTCLTCGQEYTDDSWHSHDGSCETIEAEKVRTFGKYYKAKPSKGSMFQVGRRVQHNYQGKWYGAVLKKKMNNGAWELELSYINKTVYAKQHLIRKPKGKDAQEILGLIPPEELEKIKLKRDMLQNPKKYRDAKPAVDKKPEKTESPAKEEKKKKRKVRSTDPAVTPTKRRKVEEPQATKKVRVKKLKQSWKTWIQDAGGSMTLKKLLKQTKKQFGKETNVIL